MVRCCLATDRENRYADATKLYADLLKAQYAVSPRPRLRDWLVCFLQNARRNSVAKVPDSQGPDDLTVPAQRCLPSSRSN